MGKKHTVDAPELPPHSEEIERAVLGSILLDPETAAERVAVLEREDFFTGPARAAFRGLKEIVQTGSRTDIVLLTAHLDFTEKLQEAGGADWISALPDAAPCGSAFESYLPELKDLSRRREMLRLGDAIMAAARNGGGHEEEVGRALELLQAKHRDSSPEPTPFANFTSPPQDDPGELIRNHYLNRTGSLLVNAATGVGKSVIENQLSVCWSLGRTFLGLCPPRPMTILTYQAENADADLGYNRDGIFESLGLSEADIEAVRSRYWIVRHSGRTGAEFVRHDLEPVLRELKPDLFWLDPLFAFAGCDVKDQASMTYFLRGLIQPVLVNYRCACAATHHTNKPPTDKATHRRGWTSYDYAYTGSGSIELSNWARAIIHFEPAGEGTGVFRVAYGKRGGRLGARVQFIRHSGNRDRPAWTECTPEETSEASQATGEQQRKSVAAMILSRFKPGERILKAEVETWPKLFGVTRTEFRAALAACTDVTKTLERVDEKKGRTRVAYIARTSQPAPETPQVDDDPFA